MARKVGPVDIGVAAVLLVAIVLPARSMYAAPVMKQDKDYATSLAEARTLVAPADGTARADLARRLSDQRLNDWALEDAMRGADLGRQSVTRWRSLLAVSIAYVDRFDPPAALDYVNRALSACEDVQKGASPDACPAFEQIRMRLYQEHLDAGVKSKIDPKKDPNGFRKAGEKGVRAVHINSHDFVDTPAPKKNSGSGSG